MSGALPIVHVVRPRPPWRSAEFELTECGLSPSEHQSIERADFVKRYKDLGRERSAMLTCMTCMTTFERYGGVGQFYLPATWEDDPVHALIPAWGGARLTPIVVRPPAMKPGITRAGGPSPGPRGPEWPKDRQAREASDATSASRAAVPGAPCSKSICLLKFRSS